MTFSFHSITWRWLTRQLFASSLLAVLCASSSARAAIASPGVTFSRYQVILDRMPFGEPPPAAPVAVAKPVSDIPPKTAFINDLRMCAITETDAGLRVGLVDIRSKKSYFLRIGESEDDIELLDADYEKESAILRKGSEEYPIYMNKASITGSAASAGKTAPVTRAAPSRKRISYSDRLRKRREEQAKRRDALENRLTGEELVQHLQKYQMEVIRKGMPALPIPLTQEMDDELVQEGVLPPLE